MALRKAELKEEQQNEIKKEGLNDKINNINEMNINSIKNVIHNEIHNEINNELVDDVKMAASGCPTDAIEIEENA